MLTRYLVIALSTVVVSCGGGGSPPAPINTIETAPKITQFSFLKVNNPSLSEDIDLSLQKTVITGRVEANVDDLVATIIHDGAQITVGGVSQTDSITSNDFTQPLTYTLSSQSGLQTTYSVDITQFTGLPIIYLTTNNNAPIGREDYVEGRISVDGWRDYPSLDEMNMKIRGRGNSTWYLHPKKPYQMKLDDKKEFLGMPNNKKWLFLAEYSDKSLLRNTIVFEMGYISSLDWTPASTFAEVFLNGEYNGVYNITQKVEVDSTRVNLGDDGYLLEIDNFDRIDKEEDVYIENTRFEVINIKEPELVRGDDKYNYIENLIREFESNLFGGNFADPVDGYAKYIDIDSFIDWFLINEIVKNQDSISFSSIYLNVIPGEKIKMGPLWDFDLGFGNVDYSDATYTEGFWVRWNPWIDRLLQDPAFADKVRTRFAYFKDNEDYILGKIDQYAEKLKWSQQENDDKWNLFGVQVWPNPEDRVFDTHAEEVAHLKSWYQARMDWLETALNTL